MFFVYAAFLTFVHVFRMVKMNIALIAIMLLATSMSKMYLTKTRSKKYLIKTGQRHTTRKMRTRPTFSKIEDDKDNVLDHLGQGEDEVNVIHVVGGKFLVFRIVFRLKARNMGFSTNKMVGIKIICYFIL